MKESIIIKNFGPIQEMEISDVRPFTIFIGESGSGKSTIMKVIILFRWIYKWVNIRSYLRQANISKSFVDLEFKPLLMKNGLLEYLQDDTEIVYTRGANTISFSGVLKAGITIPEAELSLEKMSFITDKRNIIPDLLSGRIQMRSDFYLEETLNDIALAIDKIKAFDIPYLGVKLEVGQERGALKYDITNIDKQQSFKVSLNNASSGTQTLVPLAVIIEYFATYYDFKSRFNKVIIDFLAQNDSLKDFRAGQNIGDIKYKNIHIHIEEPELSLYPESQCSLINFIVNRCFMQHHDDYNMTVMLATHSPYIINHLNLLIKAYDKDKLIEGASLNYADIGVYQIADGKNYDLKVQNEHLVNTNPLSDPINAIYDQYNSL